MSKIVYTPGCWDLLHVGHVKFLRRASQLGDKLIVGVADDQVVLTDKGELPIIPAYHRMQILSELRFVNHVAVYHALEFLTHLRQFNPDVLAVGKYWGDAARHVDAERWISTHGGQVVRIDYSPQVSTTMIKEKIINAARSSSV